MSYQSYEKLRSVVQADIPSPVRAYHPEAVHIDHLQPDPTSKGAACSNLHYNLFTPVSSSVYIRAKQTD